MARPRRASPDQDHGETGKEMQAQPEPSPIDHWELGQTLRIKLHVVRPSRMLVKSKVSYGQKTEEL